MTKLLLSEKRGFSDTLFERRQSKIWQVSTQNINTQSTAHFIWGWQMTVVVLFHPFPHLSSHSTRLCCGTFYYMQRVIPYTLLYRLAFHICHEMMMMMSAWWCDTTALPKNNSRYQSIVIDSKARVTTVVPYITIIVWNCLTVFPVGI